MATSTTPVPLNAETAALLSQLAYLPIGSAVSTTPIPVGWTEINNVPGTNQSISQLLIQDGVEVGIGDVLVNQFRVFINGSNQIVIAFKGSSPPDPTAGQGLNNFENWYSDLFNSGNSAFAQVSSAAQTVLAALKKQYPNATIYTDGHSLGGGMAQDFALQNKLSGFGQNALPVSQGVLDALLSSNPGSTVAGLISTYQGNHQFIETNVDGDIATLKYSTLFHQPYLDAAPTILPSASSSFNRELIGVAAGVV